MVAVLSPIWPHLTFPVETEKKKNSINHHPSWHWQQQKQEKQKYSKLCIADFI